jgi:ABC-type Fe3+ transport system permease subunit
MEAGQTPSPPQSAAPRPAAPPPAGARVPPAKGNTGRRILVLVVVLLFAFAGAVMIALSLDLAEGPRCEQVLSGEEPPNADGECLDASKTAQTVSVVLTFLSGLAAAAVVLAGLYFVFRGRGGTLVAIAAAAAIVLGAAGIVIG